MTQPSSMPKIQNAPAPPVGARVRRFARWLLAPYTDLLDLLQYRHERKYSRARMALIAGLLLLAGAAFIAPWLFMLSGSLKSEQAMQAGGFNLFPRNLHLMNYPRALVRMHFVNALANTIFVTTLCVLGQVISSSLVGFGFARHRFFGKNTLFVIMLSTLMLPAQVTIIPVFLLFRSLGWINTFLPLIIPAWLASPFFVFMFRQFFAQIPEELIEAARMDGCSEWTIYLRLMLPLSAPVIAITAIFSFLGAWNDYFSPLIYLDSPRRYTLALALAGFNGQYGVTHPQYLLAASCVTMLPCLVLFFAAQRYFVESQTFTGIKG